MKGKKTPACGACGSGDIVKASFAHENGMSVGRTQPPRKSWNATLPFSLATIALFVVAFKTDMSNGTFLFWMAVVVVFGLVMWVRFKSKDDAVNATRMAEYDRQWLCRKCGEVGEPV